MSFNYPGSPSREQLNDGPLAHNKPSHVLFYGSFINESEDSHLGLKHRSRVDHFISKMEDRYPRQLHPSCLSLPFL